jgi:hypothetical protein
MKNVLRLVLVAALAAVFALPAFAQTTSPAGTAAAPSPQDAEAKAALYKKFTDNYKGTPEQQKIADEAGKEYIGKYSSDPDPNNAQIVSFIQKWLTKYEKAVHDFEFTQAIANNPAQAFQLGRQMLASDPDNLKINLQLVQAGVNAVKANNKSLNADAVSAAKRALQLIEQGKTSDSWGPFANQQDAPGGLHYMIGFFQLESAPEEAATHLIQAAQASGSSSKEPTTYQYLGVAYLTGEFKRLAAEYKEKYENKEETPESKALYERVNEVLDRVIDAYARSVAYSANGTKPEQVKFNADMKTKLTALYKQRHDNSDAGLQELIASVTSKPLPLPGQTPAPAPTPTGTSGATGTDGMGTATATQPAANTPKPTAMTPAPKPAATTAPSPKPVTPKPLSKITPAAKSTAKANSTTAGH